MFSGYLLKIDGTRVPNNYIVESSYEVSSSPIIINDYYDANYERHITRAPKDDLTIKFNLRVMEEADLRVVLPMLSDTMEVEYYDQLDGSYKTDTFTYDQSLAPSILKINNAKIYFAEQSITLIRKAVAS